MVPVLLAYFLLNTYAVDAKHRAIVDLLRSISPSIVIDLGCNAGEYSFLAAEQGAKVLACDCDEEALTTLQNRVEQRNLGVCTMLLNLARPTPAIGWNNLEVKSAIDRLTNKADCVFALGFLDHILVNERIPLLEIVHLLQGVSQQSTKPMVCA